MNKKLSLVFVLVILSTAAVRGQRTISLSATFSPTLSRTSYTNRYFFPESDGQIVEPVFLNGKHWATGFSGGLSVLYTYAPGWSVSSGIWFHQLTTRQNRQPTAGEGTIALHTRAIRLPLLLNYFSSRKRLSPYYSFGLFVDLPILSRITVTRVGETTQYLRLKPPLTRPIFLGMLAAGIRYRLTDQFTLMAQPAWTYNFGQFGASSIHNPSFEVSLLTQIAYTF